MKLLFGFLATSILVGAFAPALAKDQGQSGAPTVHGPGSTHDPIVYRPVHGPGSTHNPIAGSPAKTVVRDHRRSCATSHHGGCREIDLQNAEGGRLVTNSSSTRYHGSDGTGRDHRSH
jgi:hypothetical protein